MVRMPRRELKVGAVLLSALALLAVGILLIGQENNLFSRKARYHVKFATVSGLNEGSPVQLNGVRVGIVERIVLPERIDQELITVWVAIDRRYAPRVREDSVARIKTLGLLGDKYIEISSGSPQFAQLRNRGEIPTAGATDVDRLIASGEDVVQNVVHISHSLKNILGRMERGEGVLGDLVTDSPQGNDLRHSLTGSLQSVERLATSIEQGRGPLGRMISDEKLGNDVAAAVARFHGILDKAEHGDGAFAALLGDPRTKEQLQGTLASAKVTADELAAFAGDLRRGDGLVPKLLHDEAYGRQLAGEIEAIVGRLNRVSQKLESGDGTLGKLLNDPGLYDAIEEVTIGVNESRMLRWLIRNRQQKGIEKRYREAGGPPNPGPEDMPGEIPDETPRPPAEDAAAPPR